MNIEDQLISAYEMRRAVLLWSERFQPGDRWDSEDRRDLESVLGGTVEANPTSHHRRQLDQIREHIEAPGAASYIERTTVLAILDAAPADDSDREEAGMA